MVEWLRLNGHRVTLVVRGSSVGGEMIEEAKGWSRTWGVEMMCDTGLAVAPAGRKRRRPSLSGLPL